MQSSVWAYGPSGTGKTTLLMDLAARNAIKVPGGDFGSDMWKMHLGGAYVTNNPEGSGCDLIVYDLLTPQDEEKNRAAFELLLSLASGAEIEVDVIYRRPAKVRCLRVLISSEISPEQGFPFAFKHPSLARRDASLARGDMARFCSLFSVVEKKAP